MILGINASRARSGGARAHLVGILAHVNPGAHGIDEVHLWAYEVLLNAIPDRPWLRKHRVAALQSKLIYQVWWERWHLPVELRNSRCDIVFNVDAGTVARFRPSVTMSQDMLSYEVGELQRHRGKAWLRIVMLRHIQNRSLRAAQGAIFLTHYAARVIQQSCGVLANVALIPHGVDDAFREGSPRAVWPADGNRPVRCVYVSPVSLFKHQWVTVRAVAQLRSRGHDLELILAGDGNGAARALLDAEIARSDLNGSWVRRLGHVPHDELPALLAGSDVFVFASSCENMPITILEAMAAGLPIACSDRGPMPEVLADGGIYFDPENPDSISEALSQLLGNDALRSRLARRACELASAYSWTRCANETFAFLARTQTLYEA
jgi:glycosyltransferase involved in cell wall biosynthesis